MKRFNPMAMVLRGIVKTFIVSMASRGWLGAGDASRLIKVLGVRHA